MSSYSPPPGCQSAAGRIARWPAARSEVAIGCRTIVATGRVADSPRRARGPTIRPWWPRARTLTYAELDERARGWRAGSPCRPGSGSATALPPGLAFCELLHALPRRGAALVPLDPRGAGRPGSAARPAVRRGAARHGGPGRRAHRHPHLRHHGRAQGGRADLRQPRGERGRVRRRLGVEPGDRWLCPLPLHHVGGLAC